MRETPVLILMAVQGPEIAEPKCCTFEKSPHARKKGEPQKNRIRMMVFRVALNTRKVDGCEQRTEGSGAANANVACHLNLHLIRSPPITFDKLFGR